MRYQEILEACWTGYRQAGMKKKGDRMVPNCVPVSEQEMEEDLKKWFKEKWVRFGPDGKIRGDCARGSSKEGKPKCLPQAKAHALGKAGRASSAAKKRREDPNPERRGAAKNVATKVKEGVPQQAIHRYLAIDAETDVEAVRAAIKAISQDSALSDSQKSRYLGYIFALVRKHRLLIGRPYYQFLQRYMEEQVDNEWDDPDEFGMPGSEFFPDDDRLRDGDYVRDRQDGEYGEVFRMSGDPTERRVRILDRDGKGWYISPDRLVAVERDDPAILKFFGKKRHRDMDEQLDEKQDACYRKVKSRYKVWPSAYASGALVQCRKKGAANWGTGAKKK